MNTDLPPAERCSVEPTAAQLGALDELDADVAVVMLNLVRFRDVADYSHRPDLAPEAPISGAEAYRRYSAAAQDTLGAIGGAVEHFRSCRPTFIGPDGEQWDAVLTVRYPNPAAFRALINHPAYVEAAVHRTAALVDSRLIPTSG
ncbi:DUF1330 domain-containing protein [Nocardioides jishulii]|uniref:DUF1330 domain-containing protein n=1 Tax=Nocardioides jishulii TaxID=2575440 RepID=A0A4U2YLI4_9ACTN|nr:DUF1330 domain-containing protein [Nocardioides jishulii]QCX26962.1 DUF1330 domain-containing protein [Nocardioides jishulii]TKI61445.1 DUF1330 domain-containing protein [Nocardioides jishulii]